MSVNTYIGWDIGGAHLKVASIDGYGSVNFAKQLATPLWKGLDSLEEAISKIQNEISDGPVTHTFTMTAELTDIFRDRDSGVKALIHFLSDYFDEEQYLLYSGKKGLIKASHADAHVSDIASANWHATASFVAQHTDAGILIDIGSTTTDIIPFESGQAINTSYTDYERLRHNELVYTGITRTPVMAVVNKMLHEGQWQNITAENFSTMADIYRLTGELNEQDDMMSAADNAGKTRSDSARRLLRMVGLDLHNENDINSAVDMAKQVVVAQLEHVNESLTKVLSASEVKETCCLIASGAGYFMVPKLAEMNNLPYIDFTDLLSHPEDDKSRVLGCATAVSVAQLSRHES